ncbi:MAG: cytochrome c-type biogenesis protein [Iamia sp.]
MSRRVLWGLLGLVTVLALVVGAPSSGSRSADDRLQSIASSVRCPTCSGQSVATSDAPAAKAIRSQIKDDIEAGRSDDVIRTRLAEGPYDDLLLTPPRSGFAGLVWVIPVAAVVIAFGGLALAFRRWERDAPSGPSGKDRALVAAALGHDPDDPHGEGSGR